MFLKREKGERREEGGGGIWFSSHIKPQRSFKGWVMVDGRWLRGKLCSAALFHLLFHLGPTSRRRRRRRQINDD